MPVGEPISGIPDSGVSGMTGDGELGAGNSAQFDYSFNQNGEIHRIYAKSYPGHETDVEYRCFLIPDETENATNLLLQNNADSLNHLAGDDQIWDFEMSREFGPDDTLRFDYVNNDSNNPHNVHMLAMVNYGIDEQVEQLVEDTSDTVGGLF